MISGKLEWSIQMIDCTQTFFFLRSLMLSRAFTYLVEANISSNFFFKAIPSLNGLQLKPGKQFRATMLDVIIIYMVTPHRYTDVVLSVILWSLNMYTCTSSQDRKYLRLMFTMARCFATAQVPILSLDVNICADTTWLTSWILPDDRIWHSVVSALTHPRHASSKVIK